MFRERGEGEGMGKISHILLFVFVLFYVFFSARLREGKVLLRLSAILEVVQSQFKDTSECEKMKIPPGH